MAEGRFIDKHQLNIEKAEAFNRMAQNKYFSWILEGLLLVIAKNAYAYRVVYKLVKQLQVQKSFPTLRNVWIFTNIS